jgi:molybdopterin synthase sulfur carrier subunit
MAEVELDGMLREFGVGRHVRSDAGTVEALLSDLESRYPRLRFRLRDESGALRRFVRVFVNGEDVATRGGLGTPLGSDDRVDILHSIQGG